uniref:Zinc finger and SCAN domain containing 1 n=1 Tax=Loxodonta africana TaxID=9785 RepID=G3U407_LOXAF
EAWHLCFRQFKYCTVTGLQQALSQLWTLCHLWLWPDTCSKEQILELLVLEQFLSSLTCKMRSWVQSQGPQTCREATSLVEDLMQMFQQEASMAPEILDSIENSPKRKGKQLAGNAKSSSPLKVLQMQIFCSGFSSGVHVVGHQETTSRTLPAIPLWSLQGIVPEGYHQGSNRLQFRHTSGPLDSALLSSCHHRFMPSSLGRDPTGRRCHCPYNCGIHDAMSCHWLHRPHRLQTEKKPLECAECGEVSPWVTHFIEHQKGHNREVPFPCPECRKGFLHASVLAEHRKIPSHSPERPFEGSVCGKTFPWMAHLINHQKLH